MDAVDPCLDTRILPPGSRARVMGEQQPEYSPLPSIRTPMGQVITRWSLTDEERKQILLGADVFLTILSPGSMQPVALCVGQPDPLGMEDWIIAKFG